MIGTHSLSSNECIWCDRARVHLKHVYKYKTRLIKGHRSIVSKRGCQNLHISAVQSLQSIAKFLGEYCLKHVNLQAS